MTAPVLPPPDLRDRDGWHLLKQEGIHHARRWIAELYEWDFVNCLLSPEETAGYDWTYDCPLFPVSDDATTIERVALAVFTRGLLGRTIETWNGISENGRDAWRADARTSIAEIRRSGG